MEQTNIARHLLAPLSFRPFFFFVLLLSLSLLRFLVLSDFLASPLLLFAPIRTPLPPLFLPFPRLTRVASIATSPIAVVFGGGTARFA